MLEQYARVRHGSDDQVVTQRTGRWRTGTSTCGFAGEEKSKDSKDETQKGTETERAEAMEPKSKDKDTIEPAGGNIRHEEVVIISATQPFIQQRERTNAKRSGSDNESEHSLDWMERDPTVPWRRIMESSQNDGDIVLDTIKGDCFYVAARSSISKLAIPMDRWTAWETKRLTIRGLNRWKNHHKT